jgi:hypothetical protein
MLVLLFCVTAVWYTKYAWWCMRDTCDSSYGVTCGSNIVVFRPHIGGGRRPWTSMIVLNERLPLLPYILLAVTLLYLLLCTIITLLRRLHLMLFEVLVMFFYKRVVLDLFSTKSSCYIINTSVTALLMHKQRLKFYIRRHRTHTHTHTHTHTYTYTYTHTVMILH